MATFVILRYSVTILVTDFSKPDELTIFSISGQIAGLYNTNLPSCIYLYTHSLNTEGF